MCSVVVSYDSTSFFFFFFNDTATTEIYTLSLHDALPIFRYPTRQNVVERGDSVCGDEKQLTVKAIDVANFSAGMQDRKSTRLNSSHSQISYAVFCLKKKKQATH